MKHYKTSESFLLFFTKQKNSDKWAKLYTNWKPWAE